MRRLALLGAVAAAGCLVPDRSPLAPLDETPPTIVRMKPDLLNPDGGLPELPVAGAIEITFSEEMDPDSLRAGLSVRIKRPTGDQIVEEPLTVVAPPETKNVADVDREYPVAISAAAPSGFELGVSRLILRNLLIDRQGNALVLEAEQQEVIYFFNVR